MFEATVVPNSAWDVNVSDSSKETDDDSDEKVELESLIPATVECTGFI